MIVVKLKWEIIEENDRVLLILPEHIDFSHPDIFATFRETIQQIKCKFVVAVILNFKEADILKYENVYDREFQLLNHTSLLNNTDFLKHHNNDVIYVLQDKKTILDIVFFTKIIINTYHCDDTLIKQLKVLNIPMQYGICIFNEIITMNIFLKGSVSLIIGETDEPFVCDSPVDMIFNCSGYFMENAITYEEATICIDVFHDLTYRLNELETTPIFIGKFKFDKPNIRTMWNSYFEKKYGVYDIHAYESFEPKKYYRISKDVPNLLKIHDLQKSDLLSIHS